MPKLYVLMPDGTKSYIPDEIIAKYDLKDGMKTAMGYEIKEDK